VLIVTARVSFFATALSSRRDCERIPAQLGVVMHKRFMLLLVLFLGDLVPAAAQAPASQIVPRQNRIASLVATVPTAPVAASFLPPDNPGKSSSHFNYRFTETYEPDASLEALVKSLSPMHEVKTFILTQSLLPLVSLWDGRSRLDGFTSTLHMQNMQFGPSGGFRLPRQSYVVGPRSVDLYGVSLSFHLGRDAQSGRPTQIWQWLAQTREKVF
jgi:hypothetical protein